MATKLQTLEDIHEIYSWLRTQIQAQPVTVRVHEEWAEEDGRLLIVPARVEGDFDAYDKAGILQDLEDSWNNREPVPARVLILRPTSK